MILPAGTKISCVLYHRIIDDAIIQLDIASNQYFICQNYMNGAQCTNKLGYKYSWGIGRGQEFKVYDVSDVKIKNVTQYERLKLLNKI